MSGRDVGPEKDPVEQREAVEQQGAVRQRKRQRRPFPERSLQPAVREREQEQQDEQSEPFVRPRPLEPEQIDIENAVFVILGVVLVVGFLVLAFQGL